MPLDQVGEAWLCEQRFGFVMNAKRKLIANPLPNRRRKSMHRCVTYHCCCCCCCCCRRYYWRSATSFHYQ